nr:hypothetical protein [Cytobacillus gottheilii]
MAMSIIAIASTLLWIGAIYEIIKPSKKQSIRKIITLTSFGSLSTLIITIALVQSLPTFS